jgi:hypothetical protein
MARPRNSLPDNGPHNSDKGLYTAQGFSLHSAWRRVATLACRSWSVCVYVRWNYVRIINVQPTHVVYYGLGKAFSI